MSPEKRSALMARVKWKNTGPEMQLRSLLHRAGLRFRIHVRRLPGTPDIVFPSCKVAVFVEGDFWHGYRFSRWEHKLTPFWREKITTNITRDRRNFEKLRRQGWTVLRVWEHELRDDGLAVVAKVTEALRRAEERLAGEGGERSNCRRSPQK